MSNLPYIIRLEVKDIYNIILQGIDAISLHGDFLYGKDPFNYLNSINEICCLAEKRVDYANLFMHQLLKAKKPMSDYEALSSSSVKTSFNINSSLIVCLSDIGLLSMSISKYK